MKLAASLELYAYWNALRGTRIAPERYDIEPQGIRRVLPDAFVLDLDEREGCPFRVVGSRVNTLFMRELRGVSFLQIWREADRAEILSTLRCAAERAQPFLLEGEAQSPDLSPLEFEATLLPLRHGSTHSRALGSIVAGETPDWLRLIGAGPATLTGRHALDPVAPRVRAPAGDRNWSATLTM